MTACENPRGHGAASDDAGGARRTLDEAGETSAPPAHVEAAEPNVVCLNGPGVVWITGEIVDTAAEVLEDDGFVVTRNEVLVVDGTHTEAWASVYSPGGVGPDGVAWWSSEGIRPERSDVVAGWISPRPAGGFVAASARQWFRRECDAAVVGDQAHFTQRGTWGQVLSALAACGGER